MATKKTKSTETNAATTMNDSNSLDEVRWKIVEGRDRDAVESFVFAVKTTGIYCRPSCPAKTALRKNVVFFDAALQARQAGYRACKRCKPDATDATHSQAIEAACRLIDTSERSPSLVELAQSAEMSTSHFHRVFKATLGLTPKQYEQSVRRQRVQAKLPKSKSVTAAVHDAGYGSASRFYESNQDLLGMSPSSYRTGGAQELITYAIRPCSLGKVLVAVSEKGVCAILLGDSESTLSSELASAFAKAKIVNDEKQFRDVVTKVVALVDDPSKERNLSLDIRGTAFQQRVWEALRKIKAGNKISYAELAKMVGSPNAKRAVAGACAANKLAIAIPCHRVIRGNGDISGYRWGVERKAKLLKRELS